IHDPIIHRCCQAQHISSGCVGPDGRQVVQCLILHLHTLAVTWFTTWRTKDFRSLALRSSFDRTLRVLKLTSIIMTQELLDALILLPALQRPEVYGHKTLFTDSLLRGLVQPLVLVPQLKYLVFLKFMLSRVGEEFDSESVPFEVVLRHRRATHGKHLELFYDLVKQRRFKFRLQED
ncbi:hypothetical protein FB45DRAFT_1078402, partial [Roridomyces roridus]